MVLDSRTNSSFTVVTPSGADRLRYCAWVENDNNANILVYVDGENNDIYWRPDGAGNTAARDVRLTSDGKEDVVFNGVPDWVYEEEVLSGKQPTLS